MAPFTLQLRSPILEWKIINILKLKSYFMGVVMVFNRDLFNAIISNFAKGAKDNKTAILTHCSVSVEGIKIS
jgi:protein tyrosine/serine phosphatase